ncbi:hypothetical protein ACQP3C_28305, partial [Escherichia coli]
ELTHEAVEKGLENNVVPVVMAIPMLPINSGMFVLLPIFSFVICALLLACKEDFENSLRG